MSDWYPLSATLPPDWRGSPGWATKIAAGIIKSEVAYQIDHWKNELMMVETRESQLIAPHHAHLPTGQWCSEYGLVIARRTVCKGNIEECQRWLCFLTTMPDSQELSLTKRDYEYFFTDRDRRQENAVG